MLGRKRVSKGQIIMKKDEKIPKVVEALGPSFTEEQYIEKFKEMYPKEWANIVKRYKEHERLTKPGKSHPMAKPEKYLINVSKKYF